MTNPLLTPWTGLFGLPPFADIRAEHFAPALHEAMQRHLTDIEAIAALSAPPTFENTIAALDCAGRVFERICALFYNLTSSETSPALQAVEREMAPMLAAHDSRVYNNAGLFVRVEALFAGRDRLGLSAHRPSRRAMPRSCSDSPS
jgi:peptidyl-dipeptidase Dcp